MTANWEKFAAKNEDANSSFESLCSFIFCDIVGVKLQSVPKNYPGLEAKPVKDANGRYFGYQSKFFKNENANEQLRQVKDSLKNIKDDDLKNLSCIYIFVNSAADGLETRGNEFWKKYRARNKLNNIKLKWRNGLDFYLNYLSDEKFKGVLAMFFEEGRPIDLHQSNYTHDFLDIRQKPYYLQMPIQNDGKNVAVHKLIKDSADIILIQSRAGTGKSWILNEIAFRVARSDKSFKVQQSHVYQNGITVLVTANECANSSALDILAQRLANYNIKSFDYPVTLLVDAVDETEQELVHLLANSLDKLIRSGHVKKIIITSRVASTNSSIITTILKPKIFEIPELRNEHLKKYFVARNDTTKLALLEKAIKDDFDLTAIRNIRMLEIAWNVATETEDFSLENMFEKRLSLQIYKLRPHSLNLLEPIEDSIERILQKQAFELQKNELFDFAVSDIQNQLLKSYPRISYSDINKIIKFIESVCLDSTSSSFGRLQFEHRSWVDYLTARYLAYEFKQGNLSIILEFSAYEDFISKWFVPVARKLFISKGQYANAIVLGLIDWYVKEDWVSWVDEESEMLSEISVAQHNPALRESISPSIRNSNKLNIIRKAYDSGFTQDATYAFLRVHKQIISSDKISNSVWNDFIDYLYLTIRIREKPHFEILEKFQKIVLINLDKKNRGSYSDMDVYGKKLLGLAKQLNSLGVATKEIVQKIKPELYLYFMDYLLLPETVFELRRDVELKNKIYTSLSKDSEQLLILKGLVEDTWNKESKLEADKLLEKLNAESFRRDMSPVPYNINRLAMLRILGYWRYDKLDDDQSMVRYQVLTLNDIFHHLYSLIAADNYSSAKIKDFIVWVETAKHHIYDSSRNESNAVKRAISDMLAYIIKNTSPGLSLNILKSLRTENEALYSSYNLMLQIYQWNEGIFRTLFDYDEVLTVMDKSRNDTQDRQTTLSDFASIIGMYSKTDLIAYVANTKIDSRLKYGYRKDTIGFFMIESLKVVIEDNVFSMVEIEEYVWRIYKIILRILDITDGKATSWLPDELFEVLRDYDMNLAEKVYASYENDYPYSDYSVRTIIYIGAIRRGDDYNSVLDKLKRYRPTMLEPGRVVPAYYEEQIVCLAEILKSYPYTQKEKADALTRISELLKHLIKESKATRWHYRPDSFSDKLTSAAKVYREYKSNSPNKTSLSVFPRPTKKSDTFSSNYKQQKKIEEQAAKIALRKAKSSQDIIALIKNHLDNGHSQILSDQENAKLFVSKLELANIPFEQIRQVVNRSLDRYYSGSGSLIFAIEIWKSAYRNDMLNSLMHTSHYSDMEAILKLLREDGDHTNLRQLINTTTSVIELLTREGRNISE